MDTEKNKTLVIGAKKKHLLEQNKLYIFDGFEKKKEDRKRERQRERKIQRESPINF